MWHVAVEEGEVEILVKLWGWAKEILNTEELNNNLLLAKNNKGKAVLYHTSFRENIHDFESYTS